MGQEIIHESVRAHYADVAVGKTSCCGTDGCCSTPTATDAAQLGYDPIEIALLPEGADLGLGCGNPLAISSIVEGETVLDLGSGAGIDCFLAAKQLRGTGLVIGVDMTPEMLSRARDGVVRGGFTNVEFRLGQIEHLPVGDTTVNVIISNCVLNLSPDKPQVLREAFRVLKPGGRLAVSDVVATAELPREVKDDLALYAGCVAGAPFLGDLRQWLQDAGFVDITIRAREESRQFINTWAPGRDAGEYVVAALIEARKPV
jgi:arsenite methyltransferase